MEKVDASIVKIAKEAGVSIMTVSRVLNGFKPVRPTAKKRAERIREIATRMGYRKHSAPVAMLKGRYDMIAILGSSIIKRNNLPWLRETGIIEALNERKMKLMITREPDSSLTDATYIPSILGERMVDGLLIDYVSGIPPRMVELLEQYKVPSVWLNKKHDYDCIYFDDLEASYQLTKMFIERGHSKIALWLTDKSNDNEKPEHYSYNERCDGYCKMMKEAGLTPVIIKGNRSEEGEIPENVKALLKSDNRPTVVITYMIYQAMALVSSLPELEISLNKDLLVAAFCGDKIISRALQISAALTPEYQMGYQGVEMLLKKIEQPEEKLASIKLPFRFDYHPLISK